LAGFWGQLVSSVIWLGVPRRLGTWVTPKASILTVVIGGFFHLSALRKCLLRLSGRPRVP